MSTQRSSSDVKAEGSRIKFKTLTPNKLGDDAMSQKINESAIIVGASLSGLMTGIALAQAGLQVTILERVDSKPRSGAVLQVDSGDRDQSETAKALRKLASGGIRSIEAWSTVQARLRAAAEANPNIDLRYNIRVKTVHQDRHAAWAMTDKGETFRSDLLIGADGHRSIVRALVTPHRPNSTFAGYMIWVSLVNENDISKQHRPSLDAPTVAMLNGMGDFLLGSIIAGEDGLKCLAQRRLGWAWYDNTRNGLLSDLGCVKGNIVQHSLNSSDIPEQTLNELIQQAFDRWPQPWLDATVHSIRTRNLTGIPIAEYVPDKLVNGRIALVGDAAHVLTPITATGFNASLQDAATLADCVTKGINGSTVPEILMQYESRRLKDVRHLVMSGKSFSRSFGR